MDEFTLIEQFFAGRVTNRDDVRVGIGDDAAVTRCDGNFELVIATDTICEGTHFPPGTPPDALGHRCLAVNLSDLAAMAAEPLWCTLALSLPEAEPDWLRSFATGFFALAERYGIALIGGDTVRGPLSMTVTVHGQVKPGAAVCRDGARLGDLIYVTGVPGLAAAGLQWLEEPGGAGESDTDRVRRFWFPEPRVSEGRALGDLVTAMIDVSDGLMDDVSRLLKASGLVARMELADLPLDVIGTDNALALALRGGDDYELCFCIPPDRVPALERLATGWPCPVTRIGTTQRGEEVAWFIDGKPCDTAGESFRHFPECP